MTTPSIIPFSRRLAAIVAAITLSGFTSDARAVVIASGTGAGNISAPADDPGFTNVGVMGSGTVVYLGDRWVITAAHLAFGGAAAFSGVAYAAEPGTAVRLSNPPGGGPSGVIDLRMFRLALDPSLPAVSIASAAPTSGTDVIMIGRGRTRQTGLFNWSVDTAPDPDVWTEVAGPSDQSGFKATGVKTIRWGENEIDNAAVVVSAGWGATQSFTTKFDSSGMTHEAQGATGDSGGAVFAKNGGTWELIGIMHTISTFEGQPGGTAVYGNDTNASDLAYYRDQINAVMAVPETSSASLLLISAGALLSRRRRS